MFRAVAVLRDPGLGRRVRTAGVHEASGDDAADHRASVALHGLQRDASSPLLHNPYLSSAPKLPT